MRELLVQGLTSETTAVESVASGHSALTRVASGDVDLRRTQTRPRRNAVVRVQDHGLGIAPDTWPRIFEPFFTTRDVGVGTGLGLSVVFGIVQDHGGWIAVDTSPGEGTTMSVYLPKHHAQ